MALDKQTYEQLDRLEQNQEDIIEDLELIKEKLGIVSTDLDEEDEQDDDTEDKEKSLDF